MEKEGRNKVKETMPYNFDAEATYVIQTLGRHKWVTRGKGKPTLERLQRWKEIADHAHTFRLRMRLTNGQYWSAFCATTPYTWLLHSIRYLTMKKE